MKAKEIMTRNPLWVSPNTNLREIANKMKEQDIGIVPIGDGTKLLGMVSDRDIVLSIAGGADITSSTAQDIMHKGIIYCYENDEVETVAHDMETKQIRRIIVLDNNNSKQLVGIISLGDLARHTHNKNLCGEVVDMVSEKRRAA